MIIYKCDKCNKESDQDLFFRVNSGTLKFDLCSDCWQSVHIQIKEYVNNEKKQKKLPDCHYCEDKVPLNAEGYHYWKDTVEDCVEEIKCRKTYETFL